MKRPPGWKRIPEPAILTMSLTLYLLAIVWAAIRGPEAFLSGLFSGSGSIATGVWIGLTITHRREQRERGPSFGDSKSDT
jgi:hypothetical protein